MPKSQWHRGGALEKNYSFLSMDTRFGSEGGAYNGNSNRKKKDNSRKSTFQYYSSVLPFSITVQYYISVLQLITTI